MTNVLPKHLLNQNVLDEIIKRRSSEGATLSLTHILDEDFSHWQLKDAASKFYGSWTQARRENGTGTHKGSYSGYSKKYVVDDLDRLQRNGHSMKIKDFEEDLVYAIQKHFGGYTKAKLVLGIKTSMNMTDKRIRRDLDARKFTDNELICEVRRASSSSCDLNFLYINHRDLVNIIYSRKYTMQGFADEHKIELPPKKNTRIWSDDKIADELRRLSNLGNPLSSFWLRSNGHGGVADALKRYYGTYNAGLKHFGYSPYYVAGKTDWTKAELITEAVAAINSGCTPLVSGISGRIRGFSHHVGRLFGSYDEFKRQVGYCVIVTDRPRPKKVPNNIYKADLRTPEGLKREILRLWYIGAQLNYRAIGKSRGHLIKAGTDLFGTWGDTLEYCGINYGDICVSDNNLSEAGHAFEEILGGILTDLGADIENNTHDTLRPDFVLPGNAWVDAKLSEWTDYTGMLKKYLPECDSLMVVYLRGSKADRFVGNKYPHRKMSVYKLTEKLNETKRMYYEGKLMEIETELKAA